MLIVSIKSQVFFVFSQCNMSERMEREKEREGSGNRKKRGEKKKK